MEGVVETVGVTVRRESRDRGNSGGAEEKGNSVTKDHLLLHTSFSKESIYVFVRTDNFRMG